MLEQAIRNLVTLSNRLIKYVPTRYSGDEAIDYMYKKFSNYRDAVDLFNKLNQ